MPNSEAMAASIGQVINVCYYEPRRERCKEIQAQANCLYARFQHTITNIISNSINDDLCCHRL